MAADDPPVAVLPDELDEPELLVELEPPVLVLALLLLLLGVVLAPWPLPDGVVLVEEDEAPVVGVEVGEQGV